MAGNEQTVNDIEFEHKCKGMPVARGTNIMSFNLKCVPLKDGRLGCNCPCCQTRFIYEKKP